MLKTIPVTIIPGYALNTTYSTPDFSMKYKIPFIVRKATINPDGTAVNI